MSNGMMPRDQGLWNAIFMLLFLALFAALFWALTDGLDDFSWLRFVDAFDVVIISLATFRVIRLVSFDKIFGFVRNWFMDDAGDGIYVKPAGGPRRTIAELIECLWCTGLWAALGVSVVYFAAPVGQFFVLLLAVAAVGSLLQNVSHMISRIGNN